MYVYRSTTESLHSNKEELPNVCLPEHHRISNKGAPRCMSTRAPQNLFTLIKRNSPMYVYRSTTESLHSNKEELPDVCLQEHHRISSL